MLAHPAYVRRRPVYGEDTSLIAFVRENPAILATAGAFVVLAGVQVFAVNPWIVKAFKPEWSYGRRLAASFGVTFLASTLVSAAKGVGGKG